MDDYHEAEIVGMPRGWLPETEPIIALAVAVTNVPRFPEFKRPSGSFVKSAAEQTIRLSCAVVSLVAVALWSLAQM